MDTKFDNGLHSFLFHESDDNTPLINEISYSFRLMSANLVAGTAPKTEDVAKFYLEKTMASQKAPLNSFNRPEIKNSNLDFKPVQIEEIPFTQNKNVKFRQTINDISIYGSVVNVEIDKDLNLVSINSSIASDVNLNTLAGISAGEASKKASEYIRNTIPSSVTPLLYIYFFKENWRLVYLIKNVISKRELEEPKEKSHRHRHDIAFPDYVSVIVDAHDGNILKVSPQAMSLTTRAKGDDGKEYEISIRESANGIELVDEFYNVYTYDLNFQVYSNAGSLPGFIITKQQTDTWLPPGVSAHHNACKVAAFLKDILKRNGIDNRGMKLVSTVRCISEVGKNNWNNAAWLPGLKQMIYGQAYSEGALKSLAISLDVVAHEIIHGLTNFTSDLEYANQPGALNESYSDIFGILISNFSAKRDLWNWQLGEDINTVPFRDLSDPGKFGQPDHMNNYQHLPDDYWHDYGGVHYNSGIHNKAAYNLLTSKGPTATYIFSANEVAVLFYLALIQLSNTSGFVDSYRSLINAASSLYRNDSAKNQKLEAIRQAFEKVGIS